MTIEFFVYVRKKLMKRFTNNIRIGMVPRDTVPPKSDGDQSSPKVSEQANHQPMKEQVCD